MQPGWPQAPGPVLSLQELPLCTVPTCLIVATPSLPDQGNLEDSGMQASAQLECGGPRNSCHRRAPGLEGEWGLRPWHQAPLLETPLQERSQAALGPVTAIRGTHTRPTSLVPSHRLPSMLAAARLRMRGSQGAGTQPCPGTSSAWHGPSQIWGQRRPSASLLQSGPRGPARPARPQSPHWSRVGVIRLQLQPRQESCSHLPQLEEEEWKGEHSQAP